MKTILLFGLLTSLSFIVKAQSSDTLKKDANKQADRSAKVYTAVEREPSFPGGPTAFANYLGKNIRYPASAVKEKIEGRVYISFTVEKDGSLTDIKVMRGVSDDIDAEALRAVNNSPRWKPGMQYGQTVRVRYTIPINFKLPPQAIHN